MVHFDKLSEPFFPDLLSTPFFPDLLVNTFQHYKMMAFSEGK
jgi:hypothetical protein